jgi:hypothetical protein
MGTFKIIGYEPKEEEPELLKRNGNPANEYTFRLIDGDFYVGETVTVETIMDGKRYTRKVRDDKWDMYITINGRKCYWECDSVD